VRFLADMGVAGRIVDWLRAAGHDARHLREEGLQRLPDPEILDKAAKEGRIVLTFDLDFGEILALSESRLISVVVFRLHNTRTPHVIERLFSVLDQTAEALEQGAIIIVEEGRFRIRRLPIR